MSLIVHVPEDYSVEEEPDVSWWEDLRWRFYARIVIWSGKKFYPYISFWEEGEHEALILTNSLDYMEKARKIKVVKKRAK